MKNKLRYNKSFVLYLLGQSISSLGDGFYLIAFMWLTMKISGGRGLVLGGVFSIYSLGEIIFGFIAGPIVDRFNRHRILISADILRGFLVFFLFLLVKFKTVTIFHIYLITTCFAIISAFFHRTEFAIISQLVEKNILLTANGILGGLKRLMQVIAPALGGVFISLVDINSCFLVDAFSFFFSSGCLMLISISSPTEQNTKVTVRYLLKDLKIGYILLIRSRFLFTLAIYAACINFLAGPVFPLLPVIAEKINYGSTGYGVMMSMLSLGLIISGFFIGFLEKFISKISMLFYGLIISASAIMVMANGSGIIILLFSAVLFGIGINFSNLPIITLFQEKVPQDKIGVVSGFTFTLTQIAMPLSMSFSGFLVDLFSLKMILIFIGIILIAGAIIGFFLPQLKNENMITEEIIANKAS